MLEVVAQEGHGRITTWRPTQEVRTPALIVPDVPFCPRPDWVQLTLTQAPTGTGVELVSEGTWFHPETVEGALVVSATKPAPTGAVQVLDAGGLAVFHDAGGWAKDPRRMVPALIEARTTATPGRPMWAPALGYPADYALWVYLGVDLFDASPLLLAAARGQATTVDGVLSGEDLESLGPGPWDAARLAAWNLDEAERELRRIRLAIQNGSLRALAERRIYTRPASVELLRRFDREHTYLAKENRVHSEAAVPCMTAESLWMPEVVAFRRRMREAYRPPTKDILVLLPCSARKPYRLSVSHRHFQRALDASGMRHRCHEVMVTSPLGLVPRELEEIYPADRYDVPVTGHWMADEREIIRKQLAALLEHGYKHIIVHTGAGTSKAIQDLIPDAMHTSLGRPSSIEDCKRLTEALRAIGEQDPGERDVRRAGKARKLADLHSLATMQFGATAAQALCQGAHAHGKAPFVKLTAHEQLAMTTPGRGLLSLTLAGARRIQPHAVKRVFIQDFPIRKTSTLFAVGVEGADEDVRAGDDVLVMCGDELRGVGVARMSGQAMTHMQRGVAVNLRHVVKAVEVLA